MQAARPTLINLHYDGSGTYVHGHAHHGPCGILAHVYGIPLTICLFVLLPAALPYPLAGVYAKSDPSCANACNCPNEQSCTNGAAKSDCLWSNGQCMKDLCHPDDNTDPCLGFGGVAGSCFFDGSAITCTCASGTLWDPKGPACVNPCKAVDGDPCVKVGGVAESCSFDGSAIACKCASGTWDPNTLTCQVADVCKPDPCPGRGGYPNTCIHDGTSYICTCPSGKWDTTYHKCFPAALRRLF